MKNRRLFRVVVLAMTLYATSATAQTGIDRTIEHDGRVREYRLFVPSDIDSAQPAPLVFVLHGGGGNGERAERRSSFNEYAERDKWIVVYPSAFARNWNDLRGYDEFPSHRENVDDVGLIETLIAELSMEFAIDGQRVFVTGGSNGGMLAHTIAARLSGKVAAIAPTIGLLTRPVAQQLRPSQPVSVLMINHTGDPLVRWEGGEGGRSNFVSMEETIGYWTQINGCSSKRTESAEAIVGEADDSRVRHTMWSDCAEGINMELYAIEADVHGPITAILDKQAGRGSGEVIWDFFKRSSRR